MTCPDALTESSDHQGAHMHSEHDDPRPQREMRRWPPPYGMSPASFGQQSAEPPRRYARPTPPGRRWGITLGLTAAQTWDRHPRPLLLSVLAALMAMGVWSASWTSVSTPTPAVHDSPLAAPRHQGTASALPAPTASPTPAAASPSLTSARPTPPQRPTAQSTHRGRAAHNRDRADRHASASSRAKSKTAKRPSSTTKRPPQRAKRISTAGRKCDRLFPPHKRASALRNRICHRMYG